MPTHPDGLHAFASAVRHVNVSVRDPVDPDLLLAALRADAPPPALETHLRVFCDETAVETLSDIARSGLIGYDRLAAAARRLLPPGHDTRVWLDERG